MANKYSDFRKKHTPLRNNRVAYEGMSCWSGTSTTQATARYCGTTRMFVALVPIDSSATQPQRFPPNSNSCATRVKTSTEFKSLVRLWF